jgi:hypothetical protein
MAAMWRWLVSMLIWLSADPHQAAAEQAKCAAAVHAASASMVAYTPVPDTPENPKGECCKQCNGTGYLTMPDGHRIKCPCPPDCPCLKKPGTKPVAPPSCPDGKCPLPRK